MCLMTPEVAELTVTVACCVITLPSDAVALAVYVVVAAGVTVAVPRVVEHGLQTELPDPSTSVNEVAVPPVICQLRVADCAGATVLGEAVKLKVSGTVMVTVDGPALPPGPVAVME